MPKAEPQPSASSSKTTIDELRAKMKIVYHGGKTRWEGLASSWLPKSDIGARRLAIDISQPSSNPEKTKEGKGKGREVPRSDEPEVSQEVVVKAKKGKGRGNGRKWKDLRDPLPGETQIQYRAFL